MKKEQKKYVEVLTKKDFSKLLESYRFFKLHSNEYEANLREIILNLQCSNIFRQGMSILDFGCGGGELLRDLYIKLSLSQYSPRFYIFEPVKFYQEQAKANLSSVGYEDLNILNSPDCIPDGFDLILVNHALYYVANLDKIVTLLTSKLDKGGKLLITIAEENNALIVLWEIFFKRLRIKIPFNLRMDLIECLNCSSLQYAETNKIKSVFRFEDTIENRKKMVQFLLGEYSSQIDNETIDASISSYEKNGEVSLQLSDCLISVTR